MAKKLKLGVIGMSDGNGHPYSWSAIFNGFDVDAMRDCPFSGIPTYLEKQNFPEDSLGYLGEVTHIWTQKKEISEHIAKAANIPNVVNNMKDLIGQVDAVLLARDDAENHLKYVAPFLNVGLPVFVDKPFAIKVEHAEEMFRMRQYDSQIFTCSSIKYAEELYLTEEDRENLGKILYVETGLGKYWDTYAIHMLDPLISQLPDRGELLEVKAVKNGEIHQAIVAWENINLYIKLTGEIPTTPYITYYGEKTSLTKEFYDAFSCFKNSLRHFIKQINRKQLLIPTEETLELVKILEWGKL